MAEKADDTMSPIRMVKATVQKRLT